MKTNTELYERDFFEWAQTTAALIRTRDWWAIDAEALAEEIESLGISQKHALQSHMHQLVMHLLKWRYQPAGRQLGHSWRTSINNQRIEIELLLDNNPGFTSRLADILHERYPRARKHASSETGLPLTTFPPTCPWTVEQILDDDFWPEATSS
jgi:hypothetical protein